MKYAMLPEQWQESIETLQGAGHELAELSDADFLIYNGDGSDFPLPLPGVGVEAAGLTQTEQWIAQLWVETLGVSVSHERRGGQGGAAQGEEVRVLVGDGNTEGLDPQLGKPLFGLGKPRGFLYFCLLCRIQT